MNFRQTPNPGNIRRQQHYRLAKLPSLQIYFLGKVGKICVVMWADAYNCGVRFTDDKNLCDVEVPYDCLEYVGG